MTELVRNRYELIQKIGNGSFGIVFKAIDIKCKVDVAIKFDNLKNGLLRHEATVLNYLASNKCKNIPFIYWYGKYKNIPCIVIPFYTYSLQQYIALKKMEHLDIDSLFRKMLIIIESVHSLMVIHRDIKPDNFMVSDKGELVLIDFGMATFNTINENNNSHKFIGNIIYASPNIHNLKAAKYIDDVISASYICIYLLSGSNLHWMNLDNTTNINDSKRRRIFEDKMIHNLEKKLSGEIYTKIIILLKKLYNGHICYIL